MASDTVWHLDLLGHFRLQGPTGEAPLTARKAMALLAYLALQRDRTARRESVAALLWEHVDSGQARATLRQALAAIRRVEGDETSIVIADAEMLRLSDAVVVDVDQVRAAIAGGDGSPTLAELGNGLLDGFIVRDAPAFNEWLAIEQAHFRQVIVGFLIALTESRGKAGDANGSAAAALKLLAIDPYNEAGHRALMSAYAKQGRRTLAISQYRLLCDLLRRELQVQPEGETQHLYEEIASRRRDRAAHREFVGSIPVAASAQRDKEEEKEGGPGGLRDLEVRSDARRRDGLSRLRNVHLAALLCLLTLIGTVVLWLLIGTSGEEAPAIARLRPLVGASLAPDQISISPDGQELVFSKQDAGGYDLFLVNTDGKGEPQIAARDDGDEHAPAWRPDGKAFAFVRRKAGQSYVTVRGHQASGEEVVGSYPGQIHSLAWAPDGAYLIASAAKGTEFRLLRLDLASSRWSEVAGSDAGPFRDISPRVSPDGRQVLFLRETGAVGSDIFIRDLASGEERRVEGETGRVWTAVWGRGGGSVLFGSEEGGESSLWYLPLGRNGARPQRLTTGLYLFWSMALSADGRRLAFVTSHTNPSFWRLPDDAVPGTLPSPIAMLSGVGDRSPEESRHGELVFVSSRTGEEQIWKRRRDGSLQQLTRTKGARYDWPHWSPDGRWITVAMIRGKASDIILIDPNSGAMRQLTSGLAASNSLWPAPGRYIYFRREAQTQQVWRYDVRTRKIMQVTDRGGIAGIPMPAGRAFIYVKEDAQKVWLRAIGEDGRLTGPERQLVDDLDGAAEVRGNELVYLAADKKSGARALKAFDVLTGSSRIVTTSPDVVDTLSLSASPMGGLIFERNEVQREILILELE